MNVSNINTENQVTESTEKQKPKNFFAIYLATLVGNLSVRREEAEQLVETSSAPARDHEIRRLASINTTINRANGDSQKDAALNSANMLKSQVDMKHRDLVQQRILGLELSDNLLDTNLSTLANSCNELISQYGSWTVKEKELTNSICR